MNKSGCFLVDMYLSGHQLVGYIIYINIKSNSSTDDKGKFEASFAYMNDIKESLNHLGSK